MIDDNLLKDMLDAFNEIQMPRSPYALKHLVIDAKFTDEQKYTQCVLELSSIYDNLRIAEASARLKELEIEKIKGNSEKKILKRQIKLVELGQLKRAILGAVREFECLFNIWKSFPIKYNREELNKAQELEYKYMLETQAMHDIHTMGKISQGNQEGLRQINSNMYPQLNKSDSFMISNNRIRILIVITHSDSNDDISCIKDVIFPDTMDFKIFNIFGPKDNDINNIVNVALLDHANYLLIINDKILPPNDVIIKLLNVLKSNTKSAVGTIIPNDNQIYNENIINVDELPNQCTMYSVDMFKIIPQPWFKYINDSNTFILSSILSPECKLLVDTSIKCKYLDIITNKNLK